MTSSILLIYTGGTIGMRENPIDGALIPFNFDSLIEEVPELKKFGINIDSYTFDPLIDSSDVQPKLWQDIAEIIYNNYNKYDGFVILHGTDTMAYSASVLSFMLDNLNKPIVFTGSQLPVGRPRTDGKENLIAAVEIAAAKRPDGSAFVPEVCICFDSQLFRGNRSTKVNATGFDAFSSPNYPPLATAGININYNKAYINYLQSQKPFQVNTILDTRVSVLTIHPGITEQAVRDILLGKGTRAVILQTYGSGNAPSSNWFINIIKEAIGMGKILLNVSQCINGDVDMDLYATGRKLKEAGVISGHDITLESALGKLFYLLGKYNDSSTILLKNEIEMDFRGEISV